MCVLISFVGDHAEAIGSRQITEDVTLEEPRPSRISQMGKAARSILVGRLPQAVEQKLGEVRPRRAPCLRHDAFHLEANGRDGRTGGHCHCPAFAGRGMAHNFDSERLPRGGVGQRGSSWCPVASNGSINESGHGLLSKQRPAPLAQTNAASGHCHASETVAMCWTGGRLAPKGCAQRQDIVTILQEARSVAMPTLANRRDALVRGCCLTNCQLLLPPSHEMIPILMMCGGRSD